MTVFAKDTVYGVEGAIKEIQTALNTTLITGALWDGTVNIYGKIQENEKKGVLIPEVWVSGNEYKDVFFNDKISGSVAFDITNEDTSGYTTEVNLDVIFTLRLDKIYSDSSRLDEKAINQARKVLIANGRVAGIDKINRGIKSVFSNFYGETIKYENMHPWLVFSFSIITNY